MYELSRCFQHTQAAFFVTGLVQAVQKEQRPRFRRKLPEERPCRRGKAAFFIFNEPPKVSRAAFFQIKRKRVGEFPKDYANGYKRAMDPRLAQPIQGSIISLSRLGKAQGEVAREGGFPGTGQAKQNQGLVRCEDLEHGRKVNARGGIMPQRLGF